MEAIMRPHPYLRAYMAGIAVPTLFLLVLLAAFAVFRFYVVPIQFDTSSPPRPILGGVLLVESLGRAIIFPMAVVPNLWGGWNMLYLALRRHIRLSLGLYGGLLPLLLVPVGVTLAPLVGVFTIQAWFIVPFAATGMVLYYLVWKYVVGFLNVEMGIA
jgi:hypothetical protein